MPFQIPVPNSDDLPPITVEPGSSVVFVGANGGGKTRLAVHIENSLGTNAHRISAHRALSLNPGIAKISEKEALAGLRTGFPDEQTHLGHRKARRWHEQEATSLLNDFDFLVQALFADQSKKALATHMRIREGNFGPAEPTNLERLAEIWHRLLPDRRLHITGDDIEVSVRGSAALYKASDMSDGERAIFYMIGQSLEAAEDSLLIFDEPELHVHPSIMAKLWDELEAARHDCAFVFITHDLTFAASRQGQKFVIRDYNPAPSWTLQIVPEDTGFGEEITTLILGSRRPILFVEGTKRSLDFAIYRCCYPDWTVIPRGGSEVVIHSVATMRQNENLTRVTCSGIVDADDHSAEEIAYLNERGIAVLPVSEIENIVLLPDVGRAILEYEGLQGIELEGRLSALKAAVIDSVNTAEATEAAITRYCKRRIDRIMKKIDLGDTGNVAELSSEFQRVTAALDVADIAQAARAKINDALRDGDLEKLLAVYDNKGLMHFAAYHLKRSRVDDFKGWLTRVLRNNKVPALTDAIRSHLPPVESR